LYEERFGSKCHTNGAESQQKSNAPQIEEINEYEALLIKAESDLRMHIKVNKT